MNELTIEWQESGQIKTHTIRDGQASKHPGTIYLGRDPSRCDIVLQHPTVSGLHVEIFFQPQQQRFYLRNLRDSNPPFVDGQRLTQGEVPLQQGSVIILGQLEVKVTALSLAVNQIPPTVLIPPPSPAATEPIRQEPVSTGEVNPVYGLSCPRCHQVSSYDFLDLGCPWCGTSLASAPSVLLPPPK